MPGEACLSTGRHACRALPQVAEFLLLVAHEVSYTKRLSRLGLAKDRTPPGPSRACPGVGPAPSSTGGVHHSCLGSQGDEC